MKLRMLLFNLLCLFVTGSFAQANVTKVTVKDEVYYITTKMEYPITGLYKYENKGAPIVQLNEDGTGIFQLHGMPQKEMKWGIESDAKGVPKELKVVWGSVYRLWYQVGDEWDIIQLSVHTDERIIYIYNHFLNYHSILILI